MDLFMQPIFTPKFLYSGMSKHIINVSMFCSTPQVLTRYGSGVGSSLAAGSIVFFLYFSFRKTWHGSQILVNEIITAGLHAGSHAYQLSDCMR